MLKERRKVHKQTYKPVTTSICGLLRDTLTLSAMLFVPSHDVTVELAPRYFADNVTEYASDLVLPNPLPYIVTAPLSLD